MPISPLRNSDPGIDKAFLIERLARPGLRTIRQLRRVDRDLPRLIAGE
jgi:hypothetical protein